MRPANILHLGIKELRSLARDPVLLVLILYAFTFAIYSAATAMPACSSTPRRTTRTPPPPTRCGPAARYWPAARCCSPGTTSTNC